jgi:hypothetical protein
MSAANNRTLREVQPRSVFCDHRTTEAVVEARGNHVDVLTDVLIVVQRRQKGQIIGQGNVHALEQIPRWRLVSYDPESGRLP